jgi:ATP-binding cassette subfamily B protein
MRVDLKTLGWSSAGQLVEALALLSGFEVRPGALTGAPAGPEQACENLGLEAEPVEMIGHRLREQLRQSTPALVQVAGLYLGLVACRRDTVLVLAPDLSIQPVDLEQLRVALCATAEEPHAAEVDALLDSCAIPMARRARTRRVLLEERIRSRRIGTLWQLRVRPGSSFINQARQAGLGSRLLLLCAAHIAEYSLWLLCWWILGSSAFDGRLDWGWLTAFCLGLLTLAPFRVLATWSQGRVGIGLGGMLKQRMLAGALRLETQDIRSQGAGQLLARVMESETVESLALSGGLAAAVAVFEVAMSAVVLALGAGGPLHAALLAGWLTVAGWLAWRYTRRRSQWTASRLEMTNDLVERMAGHRTRLAQSSPDQWHAGEDEALDRYLTASAAMDRENALLSALIPRGWLIVGLAGLVPAFLSAGPEATAGMAVGLGGVLLAQQALKRLVAGASQLAGAGIAWNQVAPLFHAASRTDSTGSAGAEAADSPDVVMQADDLEFRYRDRGEPVLQGVSFRIRRDDWILLEGGSGGGKSSLASLLAGLREPDSGLLLAGGLDRQTLGARRWRKRVAAAPQYHENHILAGSLAFNLLMGRRWPPREEDLAEAEAVCRELGLGDLLDRMPAGLLQMVGETGWQLSQGERSRIFMARALLQQGDLVILDESFGALDPENMRLCLECVLKRAPTLLVVAHP